MSRDTGQQFEMMACQYLCQQGLQLLAQNVSCRFGELDLVMQDGASLVFVEVKYRKHSQFGSAVAAVSSSKQQKLRLTASWYLQQQRWQGPARFDVVAISGDAPFTVDWLKNAF